MSRFFLSLLFLSIAFTPAAPAARESIIDPPVVKVNVASQKYDLLRPWQKKPPYHRSGLGAVIAGGRVLVAAQLVLDHNYVELEHAQTGAKMPAHVIAADYEANLALLQPDDAGFLEKLKPLPLAEDPQPGDRVDAWQLESNDALIPSEFLLATAEVGVYPDGRTGLLLYRLTGNLQPREGSFTLPLVKDGKLAGVMMRYYTQGQSMDAIPMPVIRRFLQAAKEKEYPGFPRAGLSFSSTRDPQFRRYLNLEPNNGGVFISDVDPLGPAATAGIQKGDVLTAIDDVKVDQDGNYPHPLYGRVSIAHLISVVKKTGDTVNFHIIREGKPQTIPVVLQSRPIDEMVSPPYRIGKPPRYVIVGGLVFTELTREYLQEWGANWTKIAPLKLLYMDRYQNQLFPEGNRKIVFMNQVLPTEATIGYENLSHLIVNEFNGKPVRRLEDILDASREPVNGFHRIRFDDDPYEIVLSAEEVTRLETELKTRFGLPELSQLE